jgi:hypothetical protein
MTAPRISPELPPIVPMGGLAESKLGFHDAWTEPLTQTYGGGVLQGPITRRIAQGLEAYLEPLRAVWPLSWEILLTQQTSFRFMEQRHWEDEAWAPTGFRPVLQLPSTFVSFGAWLDGHVASPFTPDAARADFNGRVARLPAFLAGLYRDFCEISLNDTCPYPQLPDLEMLKGMPYGATRLSELLGRRKVPAALKVFSDVEELKVVTCRQGQQTFEFLLFFDASAAGDGRLFAALDGNLQQIFEVQDAQHTMDRLLAHYLVGASQPFDLRASLQPATHDSAR